MKFVNDLQLPITMLFHLISNLYYDKITWDKYVVMIDVFE